MADNKEKLVTYLQKALRMEYSDIFLYPRHATSFAKHPWLVQLFHNFGQAESRHADLVSLEISRLGGTAEWDFGFTEGMKTPAEIVRSHLASEKKAISIYKKCVKLASNSNLRNILQNILTEETIHEAALIKIRNWL
ncbi:MAG: ferritin-like domain-containing protein [Planctomycetes bacterium]|nr:ferritin-like domain-containing protein [Planctomycetota bacterium]